MVTPKGHAKHSTPTIALLPEGVLIPPGLDDLERFRSWTHSSSFPESGRIDWLDGRIEVDMSPEDLNTHGSPKSAIAGELIQTIQTPGKGMVFIDRTRVVSPIAGLSAEPDIAVLLVSTVESGQARLIPGASGAPDRYVEIKGVVDLAVECVSDSSQDKDFDRLPELYHRAGIPEYWILDASGDAVQLQLLVHGPRAYTRAPADADGFVNSPLLGQRVRLVRERESAGLVFFRLERQS